MGVTASLQTTSVPVAPGEEAIVEVRVRNTGYVVDVLHVEVVGDAAAWAVVEPPTLSLFPGNDQTVLVRFRPPLSADGPAGAVPFGVRVRSQEDPSGSVVEEGALEVASFLAISAELQPRTSRGRKGAVHELAIDNRGTRPVSVTVEGSDPEGNLLFSIDPPATEVPANGVAFVKVKLRAAHPFRKGTSMTRMFDVVVTESGRSAQPLAVAAGMMVQEETVPRWVRRGLMWALLGLVLLAAFWFAVGKPAVESAAKEAVAEEGGTLQIADPASSGGGSGGGGGGGDDGGGGGGAENEDAGGANVSTGTSAGGGAGASTTIDGRLFLTEAGVTSYEVPPGVTLQVTDIVLQNPTGDTGSLQIRRNGTALLVVELGNFRDLDYHFVAPIVFTSGQKLELAANCTAGACTPGAYFAGYLVQG